VFICLRYKFINQVSLILINKIIKIKKGKIKEDGKRDGIFIIK